MNSFIDAFDGSDIVSLFAGMLIVILWKNGRVMVHNLRNPKRKMQFPRPNLRWAAVGFVLLVSIAVLWSTVETGQAQERLAADNLRVTMAVCDNAKISAVERKTLQDLLIESMNSEEMKLPTDDPRRREFGIALTLKYLASLEDAALQRRNVNAGKELDPNFWERYFGPDYPEPSCDPRDLQP